MLQDFILWECIASLLFVAVFQAWKKREARLLLPQIYNISFVQYSVKHAGDKRVFKGCTANLRTACSTLEFNSQNLLPGNCEGHTTSRIGKDIILHLKHFRQSPVCLNLKTVLP